MGAQYISRTNPGEKATEAAARIISSSERMTRMIDQLLDFTRIRVGNGIALNRSRLDLAELCQHVKEEIEAGNPGCCIRVETQGNAVGHWDSDRLLQVFSNLVGNAVNHGQAGCTVSIRTDGTDDSSVEVRVHNAGAVPDEILPVIFEAFRGSSTQGKTRGLGLGLFVTRQIVLAHGGEIEALSNSDGTTLRIQLPRS
jgi:signal transduction histidine kinase